jgi:tetrahydromethanopterin S-methyltransferase subunit G
MEEQKVTLVVNEREFNTIIAGLSELPHKVSAVVINGLIKQIQEQVGPDGLPKKE